MKGNGVVNDEAGALPGDADGSFDDLIEAVGPRLKGLRQQRGTTLAEVSAATGISVSTLSRLEAGQRRPTLELLLPLARAYQVVLDDLVEPPPTADPRVQARPIVRHGMTFIALSRRPGALQAYKMIIPPHSPTGEPEQQVHDGYDWFYVLSGRLRLVLGSHDLVLTAGEVAEFDTRTPHWLANPGPEPTEILALFGPQGERMHVRIRPRPAAET
ncbi:MAG: Transcriptional regulator SCO1200, Xre-family with cupin domain [uncultured Thermomicrobiales bacterium]|uniref:Transcriptional regulator SCO1200, Xre-family with cupin domain n=1 Tax=uncultured Thermomicrobiales bacterium TaxID=1645740 RepID=A0A6J4VDM5_9BACT|nr:MAG: Transcriptional regulator SCO1200, Xre-family with cupin domain [uncultured Thermomicrobiales bacterium]